MRDDARGLVFVGFDGTSIDTARALLEEVKPGGVVLFARNVVSLEQTAELVADLHALDPDLLVAIDQEGGAVDRLRPHVPSLPPALALGTASRPELTRRAGELTGALLAALGVDIDFAPVCDLAISAEDNAVGTRSFGTDVDRVIAHAGAYLEGLEAGGVVGCLKHFPGLGGALADSHATLPVIPTHRDDLEASELAVFRALLPQAASVMISHGYYTHLTTRAALPATLSAEVGIELLRDDVGFTGAAFSDDLVMGALAVEEIGRAAVRALRAGSDLLLVCEGEAKVRRVSAAVEEAARRGHLTRERLDQARARLEALRHHRDRLRDRARARTAGHTAAVAMAVAPRSARSRSGSCEAPPTVLPAATTSAATAAPAMSLGDLRMAMAELAHDVATRSVVVTRRPSAKMRLQGPVIVLRPRVKWLSDECARPEGSPFLTALNEAGFVAREHAYTSERAADEIRALLASDEPEGASASFVLATADAHRKPSVRVAAALLAARGPVHHIALAWPDDLKGCEHVSASVSSLGCGWESVATAMRALTGAFRPRAKLVS